MEKTANPSSMESNAATWIRNNKRFFGEEAVAKDEFEGLIIRFTGRL